MFGDNSSGWLRALRPFCVLAVCAVTTPAMAQLGCNSGSAANPNLLSSASCQGNASGEDGTAIGRSAAATGPHAVATGANAKATGFGSSAFGKNASADYNWATAIGYQSRAVSLGAVSVGFNAGDPDGGEGAVSIGYQSRATKGAIAIGHNPDATGLFDIYLGSGIQWPSATGYKSPRASGGYSIGIGGGDGRFYSPNGEPAVKIAANPAQSTGQLGIAIGTGAETTAEVGTALGFGSRSLRLGGTAVGSRALANARAATAIGLASKVTATGVGSVALGNNSVADAANTVSVGAPALRRRITNVANATANTDAVTFGQMKNYVATRTRGRGETADAADGDYDVLRREIAELRALVQEQKEAIAALRALTARAATARDQ